ncbi:MAG: flagellar motor protein MotB [Candidatus Omnitrophica bacterium]|nr:flagellar motor protein MotB [Candidatus Omnitrophota bacterium]
MKYGVFCLVILLAVTMTLSGCAVGFYKGRPSDKVKIEQLQDELQELREAKSMLEEKLRREIGDKQVTLEMAERGLVITFVAEVLFDSGKSGIKPEGKQILGKIANVLRQETPNNDIGIEGHTDNVPIKYSGYKSNWELSTARATEVLHYLVDEGKLNPKKLSATGYGEYRSITSNDTEEGRQKNRRVEIIIKPINTKISAKKAKDSNKGYIK